MERTITLSSLVSSAPSVSRPRLAGSVSHLERGEPRRARLARGGLVLATLAVLVAVFAASLIGPFIMFAAPLILVLGSAIGPLHAIMSGDL
jgi:hypothetical protein